MLHLSPQLHTGIMFGQAACSTKRSCLPARRSAFHSHCSIDNLVVVEAALAHSHFMSLYARIKVFINYCVFGLLGLLVFGPILLVFWFQATNNLTNNYQYYWNYLYYCYFTNIIGIIAIIGILPILLVLLLFPIILPILLAISKIRPILLLKQQ